MLSESQSVNLTPVPIHAAAKNDWPMLPVFASVRVKYCKRGDARYFSHLDLQRTVLRVLSRAGIPMWYSQGFNPHPKVVFAVPLSIGVESVCELLDLRIERDMPANVIMEKLNAELTDDMRVLEVYSPVSSFNDVAMADYTARIYWPTLTGEAVERADIALRTSPVNIVKMGKAGEKTVDIVPLISYMDWKEIEGGWEMKMRLSATQEAYLNPESVLEAMRSVLGMGPEDPADEWHTVMRTDVLDAAGRSFR